jgi:type II secretion system protein C
MADAIRYIKFIKMRRKFLIFFVFFAVNCISRESVILKRNIFTAPLPPPQPKVDTTSILKPPPLPSLETLIEIVGIVYFPEGTSFVIIKDKAKNSEDIFKEGEKVRESKIVKILIDKVIFEYDGKNVTLNLENKSSGVPLVVSKEETSKISISPVVPETPKIPENVVTMDVDFNKTINTLINDRSLIENLNLIPNVNEGKIEGFRVLNLPESSIPFQYGLRNGDIVRRVNGILIDSISTAFNVYNQIKNSNVQVVTVEILRNNKPILLTYRLNR